MARQAAASLVYSASGHARLPLLLAVILAKLLHCSDGTRHAPVQAWHRRARAQSNGYVQAIERIVSSALWWTAPHCPDHSQSCLDTGSAGLQTQVTGFAPVQVRDRRAGGQRNGFVKAGERLISPAGGQCHIAQIAPGAGAIPPRACVNLCWAMHPFRWNDLAPVQVGDGCAGGQCNGFVKATERLVCPASGQRYIAQIAPSAGAFALAF